MSEALTTRSALGFGMFVAMRYGIARGIYANEAGYGTAAVAYGTARSTQPALQGLNAVMETFIVSFVTSSISALTILLTGAWQSGLTSTAAVAAGFNLVMPLVGGWIVAFCTFLFGYTTLIGWAYYGEQFFEYILGRKVTVPYRWIYCLLIPFGAVSRVEVVWAWGDLMNVLQVFPNLIGVAGPERDCRQSGVAEAQELTQWRLWYTSREGGTACCTHDASSLDSHSRLSPWLVCFRHRRSPAFRPSQTRRCGA